MKINNFSLVGINEKIFKVKNLRWAKSRHGLNMETRLRIILNENHFLSTLTVFDEDWKRPFVGENNIGTQIVNNFRESRR